MIQLKQEEEQKEQEGQVKPSDSPISDQPGSQTESEPPEELKKITGKIVHDLISGKSVALKGKWGIGKTYCVKKWIEKDPQIQKKEFIYVSLWRHQSIHDIEMELLGSVMKFISNRKKDGKEVTGIAEEIPGVDISVKNLVGLGERVWREMTIKKIGENYILCFDDFERLDKNLRNNFLGWVNYLKEHRKVKILLVFNDKKLDREQMQETGRIKYYCEYFSKAVDTEYEYAPTKNFLVDVVFKNEKENLKEEHRAIKEYLEEEVSLEGMINIHILRQIKLYWSEILEVLDSEFKKGNIDWQISWLGQELMTAVVYQCEELFNEDINQDTKEQKILHQVRKLLAFHSYYHDITKLLKKGCLTKIETETFMRSIKERMNAWNDPEKDFSVFNLLRRTTQQNRQLMQQDPLKITSFLLKRMEQHSYNYSLILL